MLPEKTNIIARVEITLKKIVYDLAFTHKGCFRYNRKFKAILNMTKNDFLEISKYC